VKPTWSTSSFVLYVGGLTVLAAAVGALQYLASEYGDGGLVAWALVPLVVLFAIAHAFRARGEWIPAGLFIVADMIAWIVFLGALLEWWGWLPNDEEGSPFAGWHWGVWLMIVVAIATALVDLRQFRFPLLVIFPAVLGWFLIVDVLSGGGDWAAVLTLLIGLLYLVIGTQIDAGPSRYYGFWVHVVSGVLIGGALVAQWWNSSDADWALVAATGLVFVVVARATGRSSWAVLGIFGFYLATVHFVTEWARLEGFFPFFFETGPTRAWVAPLVFGVVGLFFVLLGLGVRERREEPAP
jgi:hypothetical protein